MSGSRRPRRVATGLPGVVMLRAPNRSPMTLDGTRTYLVGRRRVAVVDPGPDLVDHLLDVIERIARGTPATGVGRGATTP